MTAFPSARLTRASALTLVSLFASASPALAQGNAASGAAFNPQEILRTEHFVKPPANIEKMIMTPRVDISFTNPSPDRSWFLRTSGADRGDIKAYGKFHIWLGGVQVDTKANRARAVTTTTKTGMSLVNPRSGATKSIDIPKGATISSPVWSPSGTQIAYIANFDDASMVYVADVATGKSTLLNKAPLMATLVQSIDYTGDGKSIVVTLVPDARGAAPTHGEGNIEDGPQVRLTESKAKPQPVHFSLLQDPHDKALLKYYTTAQLAVIDVKSKAVRKIGAPRMFRAVDASPDGQFFRVTVMTEPFSYLVPASNFGSVQELWDASGKLISTLATTPIREGATDDNGDASPAGRGGGAAPTDTGKRNIQWNPAGPGLVYFKSVFAAGPTGGQGSARNGGANAPAGRGGAPGGRGGAPGNAATRPQPTSVQYVNWLPPFGPNDTKVIYEGGPQLSTVAYSADTKTMFVSDSGAVIAIKDGKRHNLGRTVSLALGGVGGFPGGGGRGGAGNDSIQVGRLLTKVAANGQTYVVVGKDGKTVALSGTKTPGAKWNTEAPRPWVDKLDIESGARTRVFESPADGYDEFVAALDDDVSQFIYTHESPTVVTDAYLKDGATAKKLTNNIDIDADVTGAQRKRFQVTRPRDGFKFWVDVTLPKSWQAGQKMPGIIWFYPYEYTTQAEYDRSRFTTNINKFPAIPSARPASSTKLWVSQGYALIEPDIPIFGDTGRMNDNYTRDLKENLDLVLDAVVDLGYVDRNKMGIGGHSYGAFSTVNALTLVPYFKAGIAGDGMYNRTLTPFGFQSERRNFYQAQSTYLDMSPFLRADKISGALLMYHAIEDQNQGTDPISSKRMFLALQGLGKPAALYMYPYEDHSVATYASDLDLWARWVAWMDTYVKGAKPAAAIVP